MHGGLDVTQAELEARAAHPDAVVRAELAGSREVAASYDAMRILARDPERHVRQALADNPVVPRAFAVPAFRSHPALIPSRELARR